MGIGTAVGAGVGPLFGVGSIVGVVGFVVGSLDAGDGTAVDVDPVVGFAVGS